ncbi:MAG: hypothetical protein LH645_13640 [Actinomycetia bacterium]|nr:hypothetical protein [Actinomycetes bacterium]
MWLRGRHPALGPQLTLVLKSLTQAFFTPLADPEHPFTTEALEASIELGQRAIADGVIEDAAGPALMA